MRIILIIIILFFSSCSSLNKDLFKYDSTLKSNENSVYFDIDDKKLDDLFLYDSIF